jgi:hypothetical protein
VLSVHVAKKADIMLDKRGPIQQLVPVLDAHAYYPSQTIIVAACDEHDKIISTQLHLHLRDELVEAFAPGDKVRGIATFSPWHPDQMDIEADADAAKKTRSLPITHFHGDVNNLWSTATHISSFQDNGCQSARETRRMLLDAASTEFDHKSLSYDGLQLSDWLLTESILVAFADATVPSSAFPKLK